MSIYLGNTPLVNTGYDKANTDLSNLTSQGQNIANWSSNVTNCITEIPQDIKLELNNGTLTLKAGSKVYVPNGSGTYNAVTVASDIGSGSISGISADYMFFLNPSKTGMAGGAAIRCYSGTTEPTTPSTGYFWYDTTNNSVKRWNGTSWISGFSLPFCIIPAGATNVNQVFNGFGYIGSTVFALPGVKGLIPDGRNADGTLKNTEFTTNSVITRTWINQSAEGMLVVDALTTGDNHLSIRPSAYYDEYSNNLVNVGVINEADVGYAKLESGKITSFIPKTVFHALDYNDSSTISGWSMPSSRYIDLDWDTQTTYNFPANGMVVAVGRSSGTDCWMSSPVFDENGTYIFPIEVRGASNTLLTWATPMLKKGWKISIDVHNLSTKDLFRFIYAEGETVKLA